MTGASPPPAPESLPNYLAEGVPKQDEETLVELQDWIDDILTHRRQPVAEVDLPDDADPVKPEDSGKGTVVEEMVTCGDESCHCMQGGEKHGPYRYRYYYENGSLTSEYEGKV